MDKHVFWTAEDAEKLSRLRLEKGLDVFQVARMVTLSKEHVIELENSEQSDSKSHFYTPEIKAMAGKRILSLLES
jgi:transcriptional regulator with XRE-family HTH domain